MKAIFFAAILFLCACASGGAGRGGNPNLESELKVSSAGGKLRAKLLLKNTGSRELVIDQLDTKGFIVQTADSKPMSFKPSPSDESAKKLRLKPGESVETAFSLDDNYPFWDRLTKYKIRYEGGPVRSNEVQVWF